MHPVMAPRARRKQQTASALAETLAHHVERDYPPHRLSIDEPARRDAHPKHHGCVEATFEVLPDLDPRVRHGLFATPATYQAEIRFSNAFKVRHDATPDTRGMAIKLKNVPGERVRLPVVADEAHSVMPEGMPTQDFLLTTHSEFFAATAPQFLEIVTALLLSGGSVSRTSRLVRCAVGLNPPRFRWRNLVALGRSQEISVNPLFGTYFSQTPYRYGVEPDANGFGRAAKFCARPLQKARWGERVHAYVTAVKAFFGGARSECGFLREALHTYLSNAEAVFEFCVQLRTPPGPGRHPAGRMPLDNAAYPWCTTRSPYVRVALIRIPANPRYADPVEVDKEMRRGEDLTFSPWHALADHRPLGSLNRARLPVYIRVSRTRHRLNGTNARVK